MSKIKKYRLEEYNFTNPIIFIEAEDPDDACYKALHNLAEKIIKQDHSIETLTFIKEIFHDIKISKIEVSSENEKKL